MSPLDTIVLIAAWGLTLPYVCRLDALRLGRHRTPIILLNVLLFAGCMSAGVHAWSAVTDLTDVCIVGAAAMHIASTYATWRAGTVPEYLERPLPVSDQVLARMVGGKGRDV